MQIQSCKINSLLRQNVTKIEFLLRIFLASSYIFSHWNSIDEKKNGRKQKDKSRETWHLILLLELETRR